MSQGWREGVGGGGGGGRGVGECERGKMSQGGREGGWGLVAHFWRREKFQILSRYGGGSQSEKIKHRSVFTTLLPCQYTCMPTLKSVAGAKCWYLRRLIQK